MDIFSYFRRKGIDTLDAIFTGKLKNGKAGITEMSVIFFLSGIHRTGKLYKTKKKNNGYGKESM